MKNLIVVIDGPSGVGKDSVMRTLVDTHPDLYQIFVSSTTREKRPGEVDGVHYHFVTKPEFLKNIKNGDVYEHTFRFDNYYGMNKKAIIATWKQNKIAVKNCDIVGIRATKKLFDKQCLTVFIKASRVDVETRLINRGDDAEDRAKRLSAYDEYMSHESEFDFSIENKDLNKAVDELHKRIVNYIKESS